MRNEEEAQKKEEEAARKAEELKQKHEEHLLLRACKALFEHSKTLLLEIPQGGSAKEGRGCQEKSSRDKEEA